MKKKNRSRIVYRMQCKGCKEVGLHYPNARKCDSCGGELVPTEKLSKPRVDRKA